MKKTSLYLDHDLDAALARRAADEGLTKAELIRRILLGAVQHPPRPKPHVAVFRSTDGGSVRRDLERWMEGFGEGLTIVVDTNVVVALYDGADPDHGAVAEWVALVDEDLVATPLAVAEMDYLVRRRGGDRARDALWRDLGAGAYIVRWWADALAETLRIARRHPFAGLTDASLVALAGRLRTNRIATFDRHFRAMTTPDGQPFVVLPDDL